MVKYQDKLEKERMELCNVFCSINPEEDFDENQWNKFFHKNASKELIEFTKMLDELKNKKNDGIRAG